MGDYSAEDFDLGADVFTSDGKHLGTLESVLVGGKDYSLKALIVKESREFSGHARSPESRLLADEVAVPRDGVQTVTRDRVELGITAAHVRKLPPYLRYRYVGETPREEFADMAQALLSSPALPHWMAESADKPRGELEVEDGENVMLGHTGKKLGEVKGVLFDNDDLVGVVMLPGGFFKHEVILPRRFLGRSDDAALFARLNEKDLEHLEPFRPDG